MNWLKFKNELVKKHGWIRLDWQLKPDKIGTYFKSPTRDFLIHRTELFQVTSNNTARSICKLPNPQYFTDVFLDPATQCAYYMVGASKVLALDIS